MKYIRINGNHLLLTSYLLANTLLGQGIPKEVPKEWSISPMLPCAKLQKRDRQNIEILASGGLSLNHCRNPAGDIWTVCHPIGLSLRFLQDSNDWCFFVMSGVTLIDKNSKFGGGVGISCDLFGHRDEKDIGLVEGLSLKNLGLLCLLYLVPSQSSVEASKSYLVKAKRVEEKHDLSRALDLYLKARKLNTENDEARKGVERVLQNIKTLDLHIDAIKQSVKMNDFDTAEELLKNLEKQPLTPSQKEEVEKLEKKINEKILRP